MTVFGGGGLRWLLGVVSDSGGSGSVADMSDEASKFDPRFDPAFQRGYDGPTSAVPREKLQPTATITPPSPVREPTAPQQSTRVESAPRFLVEPTPVEEEDLAPRRANPFLIALLVIAVALVGGGLYLTSRLGELFASPGPTDQYDYITLQVMTIAAPMLIVLGIATGIGVLFIYAVRWGRR